ncbi:Tex family protein [Pygmaiobacter massiliensis]|uniref:Tex family protein n=1 Tax=Pygmaiobacter massiliensis TaxID=1917873 RepID=UPI002A82AEF7|nr:Tex family protein [Pygmaiobacter massiliensis]MDY4784143.1 Tex family protein [Pygmaiobacter massiliensis]
MDFIQTLAAEFSVSAEHVGNIIKLIDEGNTIPFIARYRKEQTGSMDDQVLRELDERLGYLRGLEKRKEEVTSSIESQEAMTPEISAALAAATTLAAVEDIYRPHKPKRKTRASIAKEKGLSPLAELLLAQEGKTPAREAAAAYINEEKGVASAEDALAGALDIIAEQISDDAKLRALLRAFYLRTAQISSKAAKEEESVYEQYYDFSEPAAKIPQHRILALDRGEREGFLKVSISVDSEEAVRLLCFNVVKRSNEYGELVGNAVGDAYSRLIHPSLERELRSTLTEKAAEGAIKVFSENLRHLLLQPPIKGKVALGLDPGYRMGCKVAVVDATGKVLTTDVIYPVPPFNRIDQAKATVKKLIKTYGVEIIAIGNGTASKETELFAADVLREIGGSVQYMVVSESGASVYSASKLAAAEFPEYDVNVRSAISIARRLQDPLAELVKIDPKAVGVGQYQHDMPAAKLDEALSGVVEYCVNTVGVDLNTASASLLSHVAGVNATIAKNIVAKREADGEFKSRTELKKVAKLGPKAFEQCAGFLRVPGAKNKLDTTAVHPESYNAAKQVLELCGYTTADIGTDALLDLEKKAKSIGLTSLAEQVGVGVPTLNDILAELLRPGRDMRDELPQPLLRSDIMEMKDLKPGMELTGTVRNVIDFGAFVDIGVHQDGLVHISQITNRYIKHPSEVLKVGDIVKVWVLSVDVAKHRIGLTMKQPKEAAAN